MAAATIPITVAEDAAARVAELEMQREFEQMIEHAKQALPGLRAIRVTLEYDPECPTNPPGVVIWAHRDDLVEKDKLDDATWDCITWRVTTFPPEVLLNIQLISVYGGTDGW
jgi:hypothetical protein